jgi:hypothetical protein
VPRLLRLRPQSAWKESHLRRLAYQASTLLLSYRREMVWVTRLARAASRSRSARSTFELHPEEKLPCLKVGHHPTALLPHGGPLARESEADDSHTAQELNPATLDLESRSCTSTRDVNSGRRLAQWMRGNTARATRENVTSQSTGSNRRAHGNEPRRCPARTAIYGRMPAKYHCEDLNLSQRRSHCRVPSLERWRVAPRARGSWERIRFVSPRLP